MCNSPGCNGPKKNKVKMMNNKRINKTVSVEQVAVGSFLAKDADLPAKVRVAAPLMKHNGQRSQLVISDKQQRLPFVVVEWLSGHKLYGDLFDSKKIEKKIAADLKAAEEAAAKAAEEAAKQNATE